MVGHTCIIIIFFLQESFHDRQAVIKRGKTSILCIGRACACVVTGVFFGLAVKGLMVCHNILWEESSAHTEQAVLVPFAPYPLIVSALEIGRVDLTSNNDTPYLEDHNELGTSLYALHTMRSSRDLCAPLLYLCSCISC